MRPRTSVRPETLEQATEWERVKTRYLRASLCHACAAQAAWANQEGAGGWGAIRPPCTVCKEIVELFAYPTINPLWRSIIRKRTAPPQQRPPSTTRARRRAVPVVRPFDRNSTDAEIRAVLTGRTITWTNRISGNLDSATVDTVRAIAKGAVTFIDCRGWHTVRLDQIVEVRGSR